MNTLFTVLLIMSVCCHANNTEIEANKVALDESKELNQVAIDPAVISQGAFIIALNAETASVEEKESTYQIIEKVISSLQEQIPSSISFTVNISRIDLVESSDVEATQEQLADRIVAVKDIKALEFVIDIACQQATSDERLAFFKAVSDVLVQLGNEIGSAAPTIHGSILFQSPDLQAKTVELDTTELVAQSDEIVNQDSKACLEVEHDACSVANDLVADVEIQLETIIEELTQEEVIC